MRRLPTLIAGLVMAALVLQVIPGSAATDVILRRTSGNVGYRVAPASPLITVTGEQTVADDSYAFTGPSSLATVVFPDSSLVRLGADTEVQIGAFKQGVEGSGSTIKVGSRGGAVRLQIRHPAGAKSNYNFDTSILNMAVRGTTALLADGPEGDVITCLQCTAGDAVVTIGGSKYAVLTGQTLIATPNGRVVVNATTDNVLTQFQKSGLPTTLGPDDASAGPPPPAANGGLYAGVAAAVIAGVAIATSSKSSSASGPATNVTPTPSPTSSPSNYGPVTLTPSSVAISSTSRTATVVAAQTGNTTNTFIPSSPNVVCPSGGNAAVAVSGSNVTITWLTAPSVQTCTAQINGQGGLSATISISMSP